MKIMRNKTYNDLMLKMKMAEGFFDALQNNKVYVKPQKIETHKANLTGCFFLMRGDQKRPGLDIKLPAKKANKSKRGGRGKK